MVLKAVNTQFVIFWDVPSSLIHDYQHFGKQLQAPTKGIMEMKLHALLHLTLYRGELLALVCDHFTSESHWKIGIPTYSTVVLN
jgi:hypothetical protein